MAVGSPDNWFTALKQGGIWGLKGTERHTAYWNEIQSGDGLLFYVTRPVSGLVGYGAVKTKFKQDRPLWPEEFRESKVIWPHRFEFDVTFLIPQDEWEERRLVLDRVKSLVQSGFQSVGEELGNEVTTKLNPVSQPSKAESEPQSSPHQRIQERLLQIGRMQKFIADKEYEMKDGTRLDVVWRRLAEAVPQYVFEVQVGGDIYHALGKLKHANDIWNSSIFLIIGDSDLPKANTLLSGTFHEIQPKVKLIGLNQIDELFKLKKAYRDFEVGLGIT